MFVSFFSTVSYSYLSYTNTCPQGLLLRSYSEPQQIKKLSERQEEHMAKSSRTILFTFVRCPKLLVMVSSAHASLSTGFGQRHVQTIYGKSLMHLDVSITSHHAFNPWRLLEPTWSATMARRSWPQAGRRITALNEVSETEITPVELPKSYIMCHVIPRTCSNMLAPVYPPLTRNERREIARCASVLWRL